MNCVPAALAIQPFNKISGLQFDSHFFIRIICILAVALRPILIERQYSSRARVSAS